MIHGPALAKRKSICYLCDWSGPWREMSQEDAVRQLDEHRRSEQHQANMRQ